VGQLKERRDTDTVCLINNERELKRYSRAPVGFGLRDQDVGQEAAAVRERCEITKESSDATVEVARCPPLLYLSI
jgi:hypothetical protein